jgi:hypothetical protein
MEALNLEVRRAVCLHTVHLHHPLHYKNVPGHNIRLGRQIINIIETRWVVLLKGDVSEGRLSI